MGTLILKLKLLTIIAFDLIFLTLSNSVLSSLFDEKYTLSILDIHDTKTIDFVEQAAQKSLETLTTRSRTGQSFICYLPQAKNVNPDESANVSLQITNADIHSRLKAIDGSQNSFCPMLNQGWWTYEFCFGSEISQFHQDRDKSSVNNVVLSLGVFSHETIWDNLTFTPESLKAEQTSLHHIQHYTNGSKCELTGQTRSTKVRFFCGTLFKIQITEPSTCNYLVTVNTPTLCDLAIFRPEEPEAVEKISCIPEVDLSLLRAQKLSAESGKEPLQREMKPQQGYPLGDNEDVFTSGKGEDSEVEGRVKDESRESVVQVEDENKQGSGSVKEDLNENLFTQQTSNEEKNEVSIEEESDLSPDMPFSLLDKETPTFKPFLQDPKVLTPSQLDDQMSSLSTKFSKLYGRDKSTVDTERQQSKKRSLKQSFMEMILPEKTSPAETEKEQKKTVLGTMIRVAESIENEVVLYVDRLGDMIAKSEVPTILLTDLKYTLRTIMTLIKDYSKRNIQSLYETVLNSPDSVLSQKLESFAVPVVEEYIESLELLSKTLSNIEFLVDYFGKFLPLDEEIDVMDYSELKSLYEDIVKQYTLPNNIVKEARAIFNAVERKHPHWQSTETPVRRSQEPGLKSDEIVEPSATEDASAKSDQSDPPKKKPSEVVDPKVLKLLRELVKRARQLSFFEETNKVMSIFYSKQSGAMGRGTFDALEKSHASKFRSEKPESTQSVTANQGFKAKSTWKDYENVMMGGTQPSGVKTGKTIIKVKMSQLIGDETSKIAERGAADEFTIELEEDEVLEGIDISDVKEMEVHFLAIGSDEDYAKMTKNPVKLAQMVKDALKSGQSLKFESTGQTGPKTLKTEKEHFELKSRYWDSYETDNEKQSLDLIDSIKNENAGVERSVYESNVKDGTASDSYSRKYHLI